MISVIGLLTTSQFICANLILIYWTVFKQWELYVEIPNYGYGHGPEWVRFWPHAETSSKFEDHK
ncbi:unannotated protein [freshwater metagenome]|uniref:Unannotated protein n=1 Tax=freshwater metagenome TaxID=449393 RepID=A0A6J6MZZ7_9ZZZZ